jgi:Polyketide cyclase / dehydrase and lipid transport
VPTIVKRFPVNVPADGAWQRLADIGAINQVMTFLGAVTVDGDRRSCTLGDLGVLDERILSVDAEHRRVAYTIQSSPLGFEHHSAAMSVTTDIDGRTMITWITDYAPASLAPQLAPLIEQGVASLTAALNQ